MSSCDMRVVGIFGTSPTLVSNFVQVQHLFSSLVLCFLSFYVFFHKEIIVTYNIHSIQRYGENPLDF